MISMREFLCGIDFDVERNKIIFNVELENGKIFEFKDIDLDNLKKAISQTTYTVEVPNLNNTNVTNYKLYYEGNKFTIKNTLTGQCITFSEDEIPFLQKFINMEQNEVKNKQKRLKIMDECIELSKYIENNIDDITSDEIFERFYPIADELFDIFYKDKYFIKQSESGYYFNIENKTLKDKKQHIANEIHYCSDRWHSARLFRILVKLTKLKELEEND